VFVCVCVGGGGGGGGRGGGVGLVVKQWTGGGLDRQPAGDEPVSSHAVGRPYRQHRAVVVGEWGAVGWDDDCVWQSVSGCEGSAVGECDVV